MNIFRKNINTFLIIAIVLIGTVFLITHFSIDNDKPKAHSLERVFNTIDELVQKSDAIVVGVVEKIHKPKEIPLKTSNPNISFKKIVVRMDVKVDKSLKGALSKGSKIRIDKVIGHIVKGETFIKDYMTNVREGERIIFFLNENAGDSFYYLVSNIQGEIKVKSEKFSDFSDDYEIIIDKNDFPMFNDKMKVKELEEKIKK
ncbi:hypothetical protein TR13x_05030 [Caloranaerobacter sp. TR13]|uniref:hypothetical protein n=1 Tax=Caloranaerobacter sp. TR13 TaxID=1302151 RepID=UPI0006D4361D|nr:hypothetical protein [Caloranaerobacter sp. TR13]KPU27436.1 hypothetical protein TR13x_05030 [Caloranaerobacter sp. TR13]